MELQQIQLIKHIKPTEIQYNNNNNTTVFVERYTPKSLSAHNQIQIHVT